MEASCRRALEIGLPAIAFTDHADFVEGVHDDLHALEVPAYHAEVQRCRSLFRGLRILSGVELGEPHRFARQAAAVLAAGPYERLLGSVHCFEWDGRLIDASQLSRLDPGDAPEAVRRYLGEAVALARSAHPFDVLAHVEYFKRYWPHAEFEYRPADFEEEMRAVLSALAARGSALEVNTTRGLAAERGLSPGPGVLRWWAQAGGRAVSFGSDAHEPAQIALGFEAAAAMVEAVGFRPNEDPAGFWLR